MKTILYLHIERMHRYVFDNLYIQSHKITKRDRIVIAYYNALFYLFPDFRHWLKIHTQNKYVNTDRYY